MAKDSVPPSAGGSCLLAIKAIPGASRSEVSGVFGEAIKVKVQAPPVEGRANEALLKFLAQSLDLPPRSLSLARGDTSRHKLVKVSGLSLAEARRRLLGEI
jgi:uncharacterized protein (TIGR00251 family)